MFDIAQKHNLKPMRINQLITYSLLFTRLYSTHAQSSADTIAYEQELDGVEVSVQRPTTGQMNVTTNSTEITRGELFKAACCNLGESFTTNPSVDVNYNDAATGARQIKLLGLSGTYVQMMTENIPNFRGLALPFSLNYIPGSWMKSIQVSKGSSSVKNGYESITGQINVEYKKPDDQQGAEIDVSGDSKTKIEATGDVNFLINKKLSTELMLHYENMIVNHDDNDDGFMDSPKLKQYNLQNRWKYKSGKYLFHGGIGVLREDRDGGQETSHHSSATDMGFERYSIGIETNRYEAYTKNAFILDPLKASNIAFILSGSYHQTDANYGHKFYNADEQNVYGSLFYESNLTDMHNLSIGLSVNYDNIRQESSLNEKKSRDIETVPGAYVQYTFSFGKKIIAMAGIRADYSTKYGFFVTPRFHLKYAPNYYASFRLSAGKGYRTVHALAENNNLLSSGRQLVIEQLNQEEAWNFGINAAFNLPIGLKTLKLSAEYYYTTFDEQAVIDYDSNPSYLYISNLNGNSYSHTFQAEANMLLFKGFTLSAAYRLNDVKCTYNNRLREKPLTNKYKVLVSASYKTPLDLWQFDATLQINGGGRMPDPYTLEDGTMSWDKRFNAYPQVNAQITRWFRHWSVFAGAENITGFKQKNPIICAEDPWSSKFDPTLIWGPVHGRMFYLGARVIIGRDNF